MRPWLALAAASGASLCAWPAWSLGLGPGSVGAVWGQPLDFSATLHTNAGKVLGADRPAADVQTGVPLAEPVAVLHMSATCGQQLARRCVLFVEPPAAALPSDWADKRPLRRASDASVVVPLGGWSNVALRQPAAVSRLPRQTRSAAREQVQRRTVAAHPMAVRSPQRRTAVLLGLSLDLLPPQLTAGGAVDQALQAVAQAAAAARQSATAASAAADRIAALERTAEQMRKETENQRKQAALLSQQLARAEASTTIWLVGAVAAGFALLAVWLAQRLAAARQQPGRRGPAAGRKEGPALFDEVPKQPAATAVLPPNPAAGDSPAAPAARARPSSAWPPPVPADDWEAPQPIVESPRRRPAAGKPELLTAIASTPDGSVVHDSDEERAAREVSIDELLDLEQQAEFFVVLGQDDAAIELLVEHLLHTGGGSPLPYLKLLEIHRRRGDRSDYERMRARFNHRFSADAPEWAFDLQGGRLLCEYPVVLSRLQQVWARPLDSMAELEALMFRSAGGELFDLPAYRELLLLYALARDLLDRESADSGRVDLLLPLFAGDGFGATAPAPMLHLGAEARSDLADFRDQPTAPIDLDLTLDNQRPASIFDQMDEAPAQPRAR